jgi:hypothetical protein
MASDASIAALVHERNKGLIGMGPEIEAHHRTNLGDDIVNQLIDNTEVLYSPSGNRRVVYSQVGETQYDESGAPTNQIVYVPGWTGDAVTDLAFINELVTEGNSVFVVSQQRDGFYGDQLANKYTRPGVKQHSATIDAQAVQVMRAMHAAGIDRHPAKFVAHSMGAAVVDAVYRLASDRSRPNLDFDCAALDGSELALVSAVGIGNNTSVPKVVGRATVSVISEQLQSLRSRIGGHCNELPVDDLEPSPLTIGLQQFKFGARANLRTTKEVFELVKYKVDLRTIRKVGAKSISAFVLANDRMLPTNGQLKELELAVEKFDKEGQGDFLRVLAAIEPGQENGKSATHNDHRRHARLAKSITDSFFGGRDFVS